MHRLRASRSVAGYVLINYRINLDVHDLDGLTGGVQWVRQTQKVVLKGHELLQSWEAADGVGGCTVYRQTFSNTDKSSGKTTNKVSMIITIVKAIDGKRKVAEVIEVETEQ